MAVAVLVVCALTALAVRQIAATIRETERVRVVTAMHATFATQLGMARDGWAATVARRDTVVVTKTRTVRETITSVPDSVRVSVPVVDTLVVECAQLALAADRLHVAIDSLTIAQAQADTAIAARIVAQADTLATARSARDRKPGWRVVAVAAVVGVVVGIVR